MYIKLYIYIQCLDNQTSSYSKVEYFVQLDIIGWSVNLTPLVCKLKRESGLTELIKAYNHVLKSVKPNPEVTESHVSYLSFTCSKMLEINA